MIDWIIINFKFTKFKSFIWSSTGMAITSPATWAVSCFLTSTKSKSTPIPKQIQLIIDCQITVGLNQRRTTSTKTWGKWGRWKSTFKTGWLKRGTWTNVSFHKCHQINCYVQKRINGRWDNSRMQTLRSRLKCSEHQRCREIWIQIKSFKEVSLASNKGEVIKIFLGARKKTTNHTITLRSNLFQANKWLKPNRCK
jgi:hypothetical protein